MSSASAVLLQQIQEVEATIRLLEESNQSEVAELKREELKLLYQRFHNVNHALNEGRTILKG